MAVWMAVWMAAVTMDGRADDTVSFRRDIRPILSRHCFSCHGPDKQQRQAKLRLDTSSGIRADLGNGPIVTPGRPEASQLIARVTSADAEFRMPPADAKTRLTAAEITLLKSWVVQGANYERHWSFVTPRRPQVPASHGRGWSRNSIDDFVLARMQSAGFEPAAPADRLTLARRVFLDLIGIPPTPQQADAFLNDARPDAYERLVDRLLASPHYGEHWARQWLDAARYSDTNGYEKDRPRSIWPYRDWVIRALNDDLPFDRFTIEQLAGDMLPNASISQRVATGFHRNTMLNEEGGIDPQEYRFYAMVDRVATTGTVWLGLTVGCAQCHSHKYDPISHSDYYGLMALMNNADEPDLKVPDAAITARREELQSRIRQLRRRLPAKFPAGKGPGNPGQRRARHLERKFTEWLRIERDRAVAWRVLPVLRARSNLPRLEVLADGSVLSSGDVTKRDVFTLDLSLAEFSQPLTALRIEVLPDERLPAGGPGRAFYEGRKGDFFLSEVVARQQKRQLKFGDASHSFGKISIGSGGAQAVNVIDGDGSTGWSTAGQEGRANQLVLNLSEPLSPAGTLQVEMLFERHFAASLGRLRIAGTTSTAAVRARKLPVDVERLLASRAETLNDGQTRRLREYFLDVVPELAQARKQIEALERRMPSYPMTMVLSERRAGNPRPTFLHQRGEYLRRGAEVLPSVPKFLSPLPPAEPANRLTFARWLVSRRNPLVGRVSVNRAWRAFFGRGLIKTDGDFGTQAPLPTHPLLLDWLACEFVDRGWSLKSLHRLIATSATYRQSSNLSERLLREDPENEYLARGPRFRLSGEMLRDMILSASGMMSTRLGGPSVFPPQPASVTALAYGSTKWKVSSGSNRFRRSLYTFSKRTAPFAAHAVFDGPTGENCTVRRNRSNTPLQALTLLNDEMFQELARALARSVAAAADRSESDIATRIFRRLLTRTPNRRELELLLRFRRSQLTRLQAGALPAADIGDRPDTTAELASWIMLTRAVMNLDEAVTKP